MRRNPHVPLTALRAFECAARLGSFTKAADELAMTQAAVSYQIKHLERFLGVLLFRRAGRYVQLTPAGQRLSSSTSEAFALLRLACANAAEQKHQRVWITALPTVASNWLVPRLGHFHARHPDYAVQLDSSVDAVDLRVSNFDVAIRTGNGHWPGCEAVPLFPNTYTVVCAPSLLESHALDEPQHLLDVPLFGRRSWWVSWLEAAGLANEDLAALRTSDLGTQPSEVTAALVQAGAAIVTPAFFVDDLDSGRIRIPFPITLARQNGYWLVYREGAGRLPNIRDFKRWLLEQIERP